MKIIKSFFSRFKDEKGFALSTYVTVLCLITIGVGLWSAGEYSEVQHEKIEKAQKIIVNPGNKDSGKVYIEAKKVVVDSFKKLGEDAIGIAVDDTAGLGIIKEIGVFDLPKDKEVLEDKKEEKEEKEDSGSDGSDPIFVQGLLGAVEGAAGVADVLPIEEKLDENNLPTDVITQDITKIVINVANQLGSSDSEVADIIDTSIDVIKDLINKNKDKNIDSDSTATLEIIKEKLNEIDMLEDEEIINKRKEHNLSVLEREQLEKEIELYEHYKDTDTMIISNEMYEKIQQRLDHLNDKIDTLEKELEEHAGNNEEDIENQNTEDTSIDEDTQDSSTGEGSQDVLNDEIILNGTMSFPDELSQKMTMIVNPGTGSVTAVLHLKINADGLKLEINIPFFGTIDPETRIINAVSSGGDEDIRLTGSLSADGNRASGTGDDGIVWSVSR
jgi:transposase